MRLWAILSIFVAVFPANALQAEVPKDGGAGELGGWFTLRATCGDLINLLEKPLADKDATDHESWAKQLATAYIYGRAERGNHSTYSQERDRTIAACKQQPDTNFHVVLRSKP